MPYDAQAEHKLETLSTALNAAILADQALRSDVQSADAARTAVRATNALLDAAINCGMSFDEPDHVEWSAVLVAQWMATS